MSKTSPHGRWGHANYATEPRVTKLSTPLGHDAGTPRWRCRQHSGSSKSGTGMPESSWGAGVTGFKTEVPGPSRRGLRRRKPSSDTQAPPPLGECQKLSVSPVSDHQRQAMSVMPAVRQDSDEESRPEKPLLMDASRKWSSLQPPMWAAGRTITSTEKPTGAKTNDGVTKMSTPGRHGNRNSPPGGASSENFQTTRQARSVSHGITETVPPPRDMTG